MLVIISERMEELENILFVFLMWFSTTELQLRLKMQQSKCKTYLVILQIGTYSYIESVA